MSGDENGGSFILGTLKLLLKTIWTVLVISSPVLAIWFASSLAAYLNGPVWAVVLSGALLFPVIPLVWDGWATIRFKKKQEERRTAGDEPRSRILTFWDRLTLRTIAISLTFLGVLMFVKPTAGFTAVSTRGDWMLDHFEREYEVEPIRNVLFETAEKLEWLYETAQDNPYEKYAEEDDGKTPSPDEFDDRQGTDAPAPVDGSDDGETDDQTVAEKDDDTVDDDSTVDNTADLETADKEGPDSDSDPGPKDGEKPIWPMKDELHPAVANLPSDVETDYKSVARHLARKENDPFLRVKAIHDYVADRVSYDVEALRSGDFPPQDPKTVFETRKSVCAGYAKLVAAMGKVTGDEIAFIVGVSRDMGGEVNGAGHAWNAAKIEGKWYLLDATWNAGSVNDGEGFQKKYRTDYLFTPPAIFGMDHFPEKEDWQLRSEPITRGEFMRQPVLRPEFYANRLDLRRPDRSQVSATDKVELELDNPYARRVLAKIVDKKSGKSKRCDIDGRSKMRVTCDFDTPGIYQVRLYAGGHGQVQYPFVGQIEVVGS